MEEADFTLNLRISGWTRFNGDPLTLIRPLPVLQKATAVAVYKLGNHGTKE
jgi:hypothetical protein